MAGRTLLRPVGARALLLATLVAPSSTSSEARAQEVKPSLPTYVRHGARKELE